MLQLIPEGPCEVFVWGDSRAGVAAYGVDFPPLWNFLQKFLWISSANEAHLQEAP